MLILPPEGGKTTMSERGKMNKVPMRRFGGLPLWGIALTAFAFLTIVAFFSALVVISARAAAVRRTPTPVPTVVLPTPVYNPTIEIAPSQGNAGTVVSVYGRGWPTGDTIIVGLDDPQDGQAASIDLGRVEGAGVVSDLGTFSASFAFPADGRWSSTAGAIVVAQSTTTSGLSVWTRFQLIQPTPTAPPVQVETPTPVPPAACTDKVAFVADVTIPDGSVVQAGKSFDKVWRLRNAGTCTWTTDYALVFSGGQRLGGPASIALPASVAPGATSDLKVNLTAPSTNGSYRGDWMLKNASGSLFGLGDKADQPFWVKIQVGASSSPQTGAWKAEYFDNMSLKGSPKVVRNDSAINFDWKKGSPASGISADEFSVRWTGKFNFDAAVYKFKVLVDDGVRLYIDDQRVLDAWKDGGARELTVEIGLTKGVHTIRLEYYENTRDARVRLGWEKVSSPSFPEWKAQYWSNRDMRGDPVLTRNDAKIEFDWRRAAPVVGIPADDFSARWTRTMNFTDGIYRFRAISDDGVRVYVDGRLVINEWRDQGGHTTHVIDLRLSGKKTIVVEYYEHKLDAKIRFWIEKQVPATPTPTPTATPTEVPPTEIPPTELPPTEVPPTEVPPTQVPPTQQPPEPEEIYDFSEHYCQATWTNGTEQLPCPGNTDDSRGYVAKVTGRTSETGVVVSKATLLLAPQLANLGSIQGTFPALAISNGDRLQVTLACPSGQPACDVTFTLSYRLGDGPIQPLGGWQETYDGHERALDVDLSNLAGQQVKLIFTVHAEQASSHNSLLLIQPRIVR